MRSTLKPSLLFLFAVVVIPSLATAASAQTPPAVPSRPPTVTMPKTPAPVAKPETEQTDKAEKRRPGVATTRQARVKMAPDQERVAPQIVTVVHRLNGLTLLRRVLRESGEPGTVATV